jgi:hypothetical protein
MTTFSRPRSKFDQNVIHPRDFILRSGWTYERAAYEFHVNTTTIWRWLRGKSKPHHRAFEDARILNEKYNIL